jgi:isopentenyl-diphosphate delta-isomerase
MWCALSEKFTFEYRAELDSDLVEWELDHVFVGITNDTPQINLSEVEEYVYMTLDEIEGEILQNPEHFTEWFKICFEKVKAEFSGLF